MWRATRTSAAVGILGALIEPAAQPVLGPRARRVVVSVPAVAARPRRAAGLVEVHAPVLDAARPVRGAHALGPEHAARVPVVVSDLCAVLGRGAAPGFELHAVVAAAGAVRAGEGGAQPRREEAEGGEHGEGCARGVVRVGVGLARDPGSREGGEPVRIVKSESTVYVVRVLKRDIRIVVSYSYVL